MTTIFVNLFIFFIAIHEIAHSMAFGPNYPLRNKLFGMFANLPITFPFAITFKHYHLMHHRVRVFCYQSIRIKFEEFWNIQYSCNIFQYQGDEVRDTDIPTALEAKLFCTTTGKFIWMFLQPFFYALRPMFLCPKIIDKMELLNFIVQLLFDYILVQLFGNLVS